MSEMFIKMYGLGTRPYFHSSFNCFDCGVSAVVDMRSSVLGHIRKGRVGPPLDGTGSAVMQKGVKGQPQIRARKQLPKLEATASGRETFRPSFIYTSKPNIPWQQSR